MAIRNTKLGGTDWIPDETVYDSDLNDTIDANVSIGTNTNPSLTPIGSIVAWAKTIAGVPALPSGWVECDGSVLSDGDSPLDGQTIPDLIGTPSFLRGNTTSGGTGGEDTHVLTTGELAAHSHGLTNQKGTTTVASGTHSAESSGDGTGSFVPTDSQGSNTAHENKPVYFEVVWIMRVK